MKKLKEVGTILVWLIMSSLILVCTFRSQAAKTGIISVDVCMHTHMCTCAAHHEMACTAKNWRSRHFPPSGKINNIQVRSKWSPSGKHDLEQQNQTNLLSHLSHHLQIQHNAREIVDKGQWRAAKSQHVETHGADNALVKCDEERSIQLSKRNITHIKILSVFIDKKKKKKKTLNTAIMTCDEKCRHEDGHLISEILHKENGNVCDPLLYVEHFSGKVKPNFGK